MGMLLTMGDYSKPLPTKEEVATTPKSESADKAEESAKKVAKKSKK